MHRLWFISVKSKPNSVGFHDCIVCAPSLFRPNYPHPVDGSHLSTGGSAAKTPSLYCFYVDKCFKSITCIFILIIRYAATNLPRSVLQLRREIDACLSEPLHTAKAPSPAADTLQPPNGVFRQLPRHHSTSPAAAMRQPPNTQKPPVFTGGQGIDKSNALSRSNPAVFMRLGFSVFELFHSSNIRSDGSAFRFSPATSPAIMR